MSSTTTSTNEPSKVSALKDQAVGAVKQAIGTVLKNNVMEVEGQAQKIHGKEEYQKAKAAKNQDSEHHSEEHPEHHSEQKYDPQTYNQGAPPHIPEPNHPNLPQPNPAEPTTHLGQAAPLPSNNPDQIIPPAANQGVQPTPLGQAPPLPPHNPDQSDPTPSHGIHPTPMGQATPPLPPHNPDQSVPSPHDGTKTHEPDGNNESGATTLGALKDKTMGSVKEMYGSATGNHEMELKGKAQNIHGKNEAEFVKAEKHGLNEPEHFAHGTKTTDHAQGQVVGNEEPSKLSAMKDQAVGSIKETFGSATGNTDSELAGKAQKIHGNHEAEFVKAEKNGLNEPQHFAHGTNTTDHAQGHIAGQDEPSKMSGLKDQGVGSVKESIGGATNNHKMELEGAAQKMQGKNECANAQANKIPNNA